MLLVHIISAKDLPLLHYRYPPFLDDSVQNLDSVFWLTCFFYVSLNVSCTGKPETLNYKWRTLRVQTHSNILSQILAWESDIPLPQHLVAGKLPPEIIDCHRQAEVGGSEVWQHHQRYLWRKADDVRKLLMRVQEAGKPSHVAPASNYVPWCQARLATDPPHRLPHALYLLLSQILIQKVLYS